jgi:putative protease
MERKKVGEVFHFFGHISVAAIRLTDGSLAIGDTVQIQGPTTNLEQTVDTLQIEHAAVTNAGMGQEVGMKVRERVREKDFVYKLVPTEGPAAPRKPTPTRPTKARAKPRKKTTRKTTRKTMRKKAPRKKATPARKASRAKRSTARRGSRKSRRRSR